MKAHTSERVIPQQPTAVRSAIDDVMTALWPQQTSKVAECLPDAPGPAFGVVTFVVHGDPVGTEGDVWLTWKLVGEPAGTRVGLVLDEVDDGPDPAEGLEQILDALLGVVADQSPGGDDAHLRMR